MTEQPHDVPQQERRKYPRTKATIAQPSPAMLKLPILASADAMWK